MWIIARTNIQQQSPWNLGSSSRKETQSGKDSCTSCFMHKTRSCAHTLHKDRVSGVRVIAENVGWKKLSKGWTALNETWR
jgi:NADPH-dependent curcumin reductase CurA